MSLFCWVVMVYKKSLWKSSGFENVFVCNTPVFMSDFEVI